MLYILYILYVSYILSILHLLYILYILYIAHILYILYIHTVLCPIMLHAIFYKCSKDSDFRVCLGGNANWLGVEFLTRDSPDLLYSSIPKHFMLDGGIVLRKTCVSFCEASYTLLGQTLIPKVHWPVTIVVFLVTKRVHQVSCWQLLAFRIPAICVFIVNWFHWGPLRAPPCPIQRASKWASKIPPPPPWANYLGWTWRRAVLDFSLLAAGDLGKPQGNRKGNIGP